MSIGGTHNKHLAMFSSKKSKENTLLLTLCALNFSFQNLPDDRLKYTPINDTANKMCENTALIQKNSFNTIANLYFFLSCS